MRLLGSSYPTPPMGAMPTVFIEAFLAERAIAESDYPTDEVAAQRAYSLWHGARKRALACGGLRGHAEQAAAMLVCIEELQALLGGHLTRGGEDGFLKKLDADELSAIHKVRNTLGILLEWHFLNGAGRLLPFAQWIGAACEPAEERHA